MIKQIIIDARFFLVVGVSERLNLADAYDSIKGTFVRYFWAHTRRRISGSPTAHKGTSAGQVDKLTREAIVSQTRRLARNCLEIDARVAESDSAAQIRSGKQQLADQTYW